MNGRRLKKAGCLWILAMGILALPRLAFAHPGHSILTSLVADTIIMSTPGCTVRAEE